MELLNIIVPHNDILLSAIDRHFKGSERLFTPRGSQEVTVLAPPSALFHVTLGAGGEGGIAGLGRPRISVRGLQQVAERPGG